MLRRSTGWGEDGYVRIRAQPDSYGVCGSNSYLVKPSDNRFDVITRRR